MYGGSRSLLLHGNGAVGDIIHAGAVDKIAAGNSQTGGRLNGHTLGRLKRVIRAGDINDRVLGNQDITLALLDLLIGLDGVLAAGKHQLAACEISRSFLQPIPLL